ncbi:MAG: hypothetical protein ACI4IA_05185 [Acutalibacteraceae bacterium]
MSTVRKRSRIIRPTSDQR